MAVALLALASCSRSGAPAPTGLGRRLADADALSVRASPDGAWIAWLAACEPQRDRTLPAGTASCDLSVAPSSGGAATRLARGVSTLRGFAWSSAHAAPASLAALADYDAASGAGALVAWAAGGEPRRVADGVTFHGFAREGGALGLVAAGRLLVARPPQWRAEPVRGADGVATFEFGAGGPLALLARRTLRAGSDLLAVRDAAAAPVAAAVREYAFARDGRRFAFTAGAAQALQVAWADGAPSAALGRDVREFSFSPRGDAVAYVADAVPGRQGDLMVALAGRAPERLASRVGEPRWSASGERLAWLEEYDPRSRTGALAVAAPGAKREILARNVSDFDLTRDGQAVAYLQHVTAGGYSVDLGLARAGDRAVAVARGVFGFSFSPDGRWLYYRTACVREAEACDLFRVPVSGVGAADPKPERIAEGLKSFDYAPGKPDRLLVAWARKDRVALDLAVWDGGKLTAVDTYVRPGTAHFVGGDARRVAYAVLDPKRQGVYVAEVP
ncbi:MAG: TolB family protein [Anaeromyxobacteraceae bacterium]